MTNARVVPWPGPCEVNRHVAQAGSGECSDFAIGEWRAIRVGATYAVSPPHPHPHPPRQRAWAPWLCVAFAAQEGSDATDSIAGTSVRTSLGAIVGGDARQGRWPDLRQGIARAAGDLRIPRHGPPLAGLRLARGGIRTLFKKTHYLPWQGLILPCYKALHGKAGNTSLTTCLRGIRRL